MPTVEELELLALIQHLRSVSEEECAELLRPIPTAVQRRYNQLIKKRQMTDLVEKLEAVRVANLVQLARLRHTTLDAVMHDLGIGTQAHT